MSDIYGVPFVCECKSEDLKKVDDIDGLHLILAECQQCGRLLIIDIERREAA